MTPLQAHLLCLALVAVNFVTRALRMQWLLSGLGYRLPFGEVFTHTTLGEAASSLTPLRLGGEPSRVWAMGRTGVPATPAIVGIGVEILVMTPVTIAFAVTLAVFFAPEWWDTAGTSLARAAARRWPWVAAVAAVILIAWWLAHRLAPAAAHALRREIAAARVYAREMPRWPLIAGAVTTVVDIAARVAILPVLAVAYALPPSLGIASMGSFTLLYSQFLLPTPAGAGAVELGFLGGAAGELGTGDAAMLLWWRWYTTGLGIVLGLGLAAHRYGRSALVSLVRDRKEAP